MLYSLLEYLGTHFDLPGAGLFRYLSFRSVCAIVFALLIGAIPLLYAIVARRHLPESVRFLEARGDNERAEASVRYFEQASGVAAVPSKPARKLGRIRMRELVGRKYLGITLAIWATWFFVNFSYYGAFTWMPSLLADQFGSLTKSFGYTLAISIAQLPGYFLAAFLVERCSSPSPRSPRSCSRNPQRWRRCCASACCSPPPTWVRGV